VEELYRLVLASSISSGGRAFAAQVFHLQLDSIASLPTDRVIM